MARGSAADFLARLNEQNERIAARKAEEEEKASQRTPDEVRLQRDQERREKWGQLRAREHPSKRPRRASTISDGSHIGQTPGPD
jgi:hypothetical protein